MPSVKRALAWVVLVTTACGRPVGQAGRDGSVGNTPTAAEEPTMGEAPPPLATVDVAPGDTPAARQLRERLVQKITLQDRPWGDGGWSPEVVAAMRRVPRHLFVPTATLEEAYRDVPQPIGHGQTISQPTIVALMTNALRARPEHKVLEIGTGSGYQAAVLAGLVRDVYTIEIVEPLGVEARERLARLGYRNVHVRIGDGYRGWPEEAPFDRIVMTASPPQIPDALVAQLAEGGILVGPVGDEQQDLIRWTKRGGVLEKENLGAVRFVPMVPGKP
jgi:protein-L-isoaspartate(D-aspartate) O-methyltransferase